ncbi:MAG: histidine--tRNA ligase [Spirochaetes bacterium]|nr:histidine--tRNA ligase [Spirochaetota bacterium]
MDKIIEPKVLKGFRDSLPEQEIRKKKMFRILEETFSSFGFVPIDTPALEYTDVLLGKGGGETDKQVYSFKDNGGRDVAMRFDLTVPLARFITANKSNIIFPFKRFHISKVWRGENTQRGRYREFYQCDFDIVGTDSPSADIEILIMMKTSLEKLGIIGFKIYFSNRGILNKFLEINNVKDKSVEILRIIDKLAKIGKEKTKGLLTELTGAEICNKILDFITPADSFDKTLNKLISLCNGDNAETERLKIIYKALRENEIENYFILDPTITRGLDYYTGLVFETFLEGNREMGSVLSGGRYNNLASLYTNEQIPGIGASIGIDRLIAALEESENKKPQNMCDCIVFNIDDELIGLLYKTAEEIRKQGISCEVYPESKKLNKQFAYAEKKNIPVGVIIGKDEKESGTITVKDLIARKNYEKIQIQDGIEKIASIIRETKN